MADGSLNRAIRRTLAQLGIGAETTDAELLERFVAARDEAAFEALVRRHGPMVLRVCLRVLQHRHDAEEALQAVFIVLFKKAGSIRRRELLANWLYGVACRVARKARARAGKRQDRQQVFEEAAVADPKQPAESNQVTWGELREVFDEELSRLPARYRAPLVLCCLEGKTNREAAEQLGRTRWTIATLLSRGRNLLRNRLLRRGLALSAAQLAVLLAEEEAAARSASSIVVVKLAGGGGVVASEAAQQLAVSTVQALQWSKVKMIAAVVLGIVLLGGTTVATLVLAPHWFAAADVDPHPVKLGVNADLGGRRPFPDDNAWNMDVSQAPVDPNSANLLASIGLDKPLRPRFGTTAHGTPFGMPYVVVGGAQPRVSIDFNYAAESDAGPYPIPPDAPIEVDASGNGRLIVLDRDNWRLYELLGPVFDETGWHAKTGAIFDLNSNELRPWGATSADGAGLPIFPGLVRYDEVVGRGEINHALRFTVKLTRRAFVPPARHYASKDRSENLPPMGMRVRLRADFDASTFPPAARVILTALKKHGMFLASHGPDWGLSGVPDPRWNQDDLRALERVKGSDFEVIEMKDIQKTEMPPKPKPEIRKTKSETNSNNE